MAAALLLGGPSYAAGDAEAGRQKALRCQTCHGLDGVARIPDAPHIGGQNEFYLINSLKAYQGFYRQVGQNNRRVGRGVRTFCTGCRCHERSRDGGT